MGGGDEREKEKRESGEEEIGRRGGGRGEREGGREMERGREKEKESGEGDTGGEGKRRGGGDGKGERGGREGEIRERERGETQVGKGGGWKKSSSCSILGDFDKFAFRLSAVTQRAAICPTFIIHKVFPCEWSCQTIVSQHINIVVSFVLLLCIVPLGAWVAYRSLSHYKNQPQ